MRSIVEAVSAIKAYVAEVDKIELHPPTRSESDILREWGKEPPELMWFADVTRFFGDTGEIIYGSFLD